jgi:hypothetical protein
LRKRLSAGDLEKVGVFSWKAILLHANSNGPPLRSFCREYARQISSLKATKDSSVILSLCIIAALGGGFVTNDSL